MRKVNFMKTAIVLLIMVGFVFSCKDDDTAVAQETSLIGSWKLKLQYTSTGAAGSGRWVEVSNPYTFTFNADSTFTATQIDECTYGTFTTTGDTLKLMYGCNLPDYYIDVFANFYSFYNQYLVLNPVYSNCDEGCATRFIRIE